MSSLRCLPKNSFHKFLSLYLWKFIRFPRISYFFLWLSKLIATKHISTHKMKRIVEIFFLKMHPVNLANHSVTSKTKVFKTIQKSTNKPTRQRSFYPLLNTIFPFYSLTEWKKYKQTRRGRKKTGWYASSACLLLFPTVASTVHMQFMSVFCHSDHPK